MHGVSAYGNWKDFNAHYGKVFNLAKGFADEEFVTDEGITHYLFPKWDKNYTKNRKKTMKAWKESKTQAEVLAVSVVRYILKISHL